MGSLAARMPRTKAEGLVSTGPKLPALAKGTDAGSFILTAEQAKSDARLAMESPRAFLELLNGESSLKAQARIAAAVSEMPLAAVKELANQLEAQSSGGDPTSWQFTWAVFERWGEIDANDLMRASRLSPNRIIGFTGTQAAFRQLARRDAEGAWKAAQETGTLSSLAKYAVLQTLGETNPAEALRLAQTDASTRRDAWAVASSMQGWLLKDRKAALEAVQALPGGEFRTNLVSHISSTFAISDPEGALAWGRQLKNPSERQQVMSQVVEAMAARDPQKTLAMLEDPDFAQQRRAGLGTAVAAWAKRDFDAALQYALAARSPADQQQMLGSLSQGVSRAERSRLLEEAKKMSPSVAKSIYQSTIEGGYFFGAGGSALEIINDVKQVGLREELIKNQLQNSWSSTVDESQQLFGKLQPTSRTTDQASQIAQRMAWGDPMEAVKWAEGLDSEDLKSAALKSALQTWSANDPEAAARRAQDIQDPGQRTEVLRGIAQSWAGRDDRAALAWAQSLNGPDQSAALGALVQNSLQASPQQAQELYAKFSASLDPASAEKSDNKGVARSLAATLTENDPQQAITWATSLPSGGAQNEAFAGIAQKWAGYDPVSTSEWIGNLPAGEGRDLAANQLVSTIARDDPESAWVWATSIADTARRREAATRVLQAWKGYGKVSEARAALQAAGFSADDAKELAKTLD